MNQITHDLKLWIAENIIAGASPADLAKILRGLDMPEEEIARELTGVQNHPYIQAGQKYNMKVMKRESLLKTLDELKKNTKGYVDFEKKPYPAFNEFLQNYYYENRMGVFTGAVKNWEALNWMPRSIVGKVGADTIVQIQYDRDKSKNYESQSYNFRKDIKFGEFIDMVENIDSSNNFYMTASNAALEKEGLRNLLADIGNIGDTYLNPETLGKATHLWIGPKGTITPLHHDLTNNLFVQVYGRKRFRMVPSMQVPYMYNDFHVFSDVDYLNHNPQTHPEFDKANVIEFDVEPGDLVFIPIGWWHHVESLSPNISLSFTNFNLPENVFRDYPTGNRY